MRWRQQTRSGESERGPACWWGWEKGLNADWLKKTRWKNKWKSVHFHFLVSMWHFLFCVSEPLWLSFWHIELLFYLVTSWPCPVPSSQLLNGAKEEMKRLANADGCSISDGSDTESLAVIGRPDGAAMPSLSLSLFCSPGCHCAAGTYHPLLQCWSWSWQFTK